MSQFADLTKIPHEKPWLVTVENKQKLELRALGSGRDCAICPTRRCSRIADPPFYSFVFRGWFLMMNASMASRSSWTLVYGFNSCIGLAAFIVWISLSRRLALAIALRNLE